MGSRLKKPTWDNRVRLHMNSWIVGKQIAACMVVALLMQDRAAAAEEGGTLSSNQKAGVQYKTDAQAASLQTVEFASYRAKQEFGTQDFGISLALQNLAAAQHDEGEYAAATANYLKSIALLEADEGFFDTVLIEPLVGLAANYHAMGQYAQAVAAYQRAKNITHRKEGLLNLQQLPIIDALTESYVMLGHRKDAEREQKYAFRIYKHHYGDTDLRLVPAIYKLARWYRRTRRFDAALELYQRALNILEQTNGKDDPSLVYPLRQIAVVHRLTGFPSSEGEAALKQALKVVEQNAESTDQELAQVWVDLGDWYTVTKKTKTARSYYRKAWKLLTTEGSQTSQVEAYFDKPVQLLYRIPKPNDRDWALLREYDRLGYMEVECTVTEEGTVEDLEIVDGRLPFDLRHSVMRSMRFSRYRPRLVDGEPVATHGVRVRQAYPAEGFVVSSQVDVGVMSARNSELYQSVADPRF
jgi:tetratricopeptide (TPR) repeat protein